MIIHSVTLENIRSYQKEEIVFQEGSTLLSGDVGSGKSSILLAIEFALFGVIRGKLDGKLLLRHGTTTGRITLSFSIDKNNFKIIRELKKSNKQQVSATQVHFFKNNVEILCTIEELKSKVLSLLGYPQDLLKQSRNLLYRYTVYTPQEDMNYILTDKEMRVNIIRQLFNLDKYQHINENAQIVVRELNNKQKSVTERIQLLLPEEKELEQVIAHITVQERHLIEEEKKYKQQQEKVVKEVQQVSGIKEEWDANEKKRSMLDNIKGEFASIKRQQVQKEQILEAKGSRTKEQTER